MALWPIWLEPPQSPGSGSILDFEREACADPVTVSVGADNRDRQPAVAGSTSILDQLQLAFEVRQSEVNRAP